MELENLINFNPSTCISGKITGLNRIVAGIFRKYVSPFGVSNSQLTLLFILTKMDGLNQKQLSEMIYLEKSTLNRNLKRLFDQELLSKQNFPSISITEKGKRLVNDIIPEWRKAMDEIESIMGDSGKMALDTLVQNITQKQN